MSRKECIVCESPAKEKLTSGDWLRFECPRCGLFEMTGTARGMTQGLLTPLSAAILSHTIRKMQKGDSVPRVSSDLIEWLRKNGRLPNTSEQIRNLIQWMGDNSSTGQLHTIHYADFRSIIGVENTSSVIYLLSALVDKGLLDLPPPMLRILQENAGENISHIALSVAGWEKYESLQKETTGSRTIFMAMQYGDPQLNSVMETCFKPSVHATGFELVLLNDPQRQSAGLIDDRLRVEIRNSRMLIADMTHNNPGAYWEAGYAEGLGKPVIYTCEHGIFHDKKTTPHFDTNHHLTVIWKNDSLGDVAKELKAVIRATLPAEAKMSDG